MANSGSSSSRRRGATQTPAPVRLPSSRERRPAMAALAVLLIVGGALASGWLALRAGDRADYVLLVQEQRQGAVLEEGELERISLPEGMDDDLIPWEDKDALIGMYTSAPLLAGTILIPDMVSKDTRVQEGTKLFDLPIAASGTVVDSPIGSFVTVYTSSGDLESQTKPVVAEVVAVAHPDSDSGITGGSSTATMTVAVATACALDVASTLEGNDTVRVAAAGADALENADECAGPFQAAPEQSQDGESGADN